jgi:uncharacterized protein (DUF4415 family)
MSEEEIMRTSPPELANLPDDFFKSAVFVPAPKAAISLRVDRDVLEWFKAAGPRYQSRMNAVLRAYMTSAVERTPQIRKVSEPRAGTARGSKPRKKR